MSNSQAIQAIENVLATSKVGVLSTAYNNKPNSRYMVFYNDGLTLYTKTNIHSAKVKEIKDNPAAYVLLGYNDTTNRSFEIVTEQEVIDWLWERQDKSFFSSKEDPELCVLRVVPQSIKLMNDKSLDTPIKIDL